MATTVIVAMLIIVIRYLGVLQNLELSTYDLMLQTFPLETKSFNKPIVDERIVLVTLTEEELRESGEPIVSDNTLVNLIEEIKKQQPAVIGLDIIRDLPVPKSTLTPKQNQKSRTSLINLLENTPVIAVEKTPSGSRKTFIAPPPVSFELRSAVDSPVDSDGVYRRSFLYARLKEKSDGYWDYLPSFSLAVSLSYLEKKGINLEDTPVEGWLKLGNAVFQALDPYSGSYIDLDANSYQTLINYRRPLAGSFKEVNFTDVLSEKTEPEEFKNKIVLIGSVADSSNDEIITPLTDYSNEEHDYIFGIHYHAHLTSQILSAALDERTLFHTLDRYLESTWIREEDVDILIILVFTAIPCLIGWRYFKSQKKRFFLIIIGVSAVSSLILYAGSYWLLLLLGLWIPYLPPLLGILLNSFFIIVLIYAYSLKQSNQQLQTSQKKLQQSYVQLQISQKRLQQFLNALPVGIFITDGQGQPYYSNDIAENILAKGIVPIENFDQLIETYQVYLAGSNSPYPKSKLPILRALKGLATTADDVIIRHQSKSIPIEVSATPIYNEKGEISYAIAAFQDISERQKAEAERIRFTKELESKNSELESARGELFEANRNLEQKVEERTKRLDRALESLKATQAKLLFENQLLKTRNPNSTYEYQFGGTLSPTSPTYVVREADKRLYKAIKEGHFCYIFNARQMGKSSLKVKIANRLTEEGYICALLDLTEIGSKGITLEQWQISFIAHTAQVFGLLPDFDYRAWWQQHSLLSPSKQLSDFFDDILLSRIQGQIVIFIDEIDYILEFQFQTDYFFAFIRRLYNKKAENPKYSRLTFVLLGRTSPSFLIQDKENETFNIGCGISLEGFKFDETEVLQMGLIDKAKDPEAVLEEVLFWTEGQPFLTQKICHLIQQSSNYISLNKESIDVKAIVEREIIDSWEDKDEPEHLKTIRDKLIENKKCSTVLMLEEYRKVLISENQNLTYAKTVEHTELLLSGIVKREKNLIKLYNPIYAKVFNLDWVSNQLNTLTL
ncbi:MAG: CHASE2 domain-containing protein [Prochloraceae cyanobacterium]|nr:CHASE2 domain-containing protein [Prochloraceae cyanobacterium]